MKILKSRLIKKGVVAAVLLLGTTIAVPASAGSGISINTGNLQFHIGGKYSPFHFGFNLGHGYYGKHHKGKKYYGKKYYGKKYHNGNGIHGKRHHGLNGKYYGNGFNYGKKYHKRGHRKFRSFRNFRRYH